MPVNLVRRVALFVLICVFCVCAELVSGVILDSELLTPVKNVSVRLENVEVTSDELGEFTIDMDQVSSVILENNSVKTTCVQHSGAQKEVRISFASNTEHHSVELRSVKGVSLFQQDHKGSATMILSLQGYAEGRYLLTLKEEGNIQHFWVTHSSRSNSHFGNLLQSTVKKSERGGVSRTNFQDKSFRFICVKDGYDTLLQDVADISQPLAFRMDRFEFCGNDVTEGDEQCDGNDLPCNVLNPLEYALGESSCNTFCEGYIEDECVPHPLIDVSGNSNGTNHKTALDMTSMAQFNILQQLQVGMIEGNFHDIIDSVFGANGASGVAFNHITGSGPNSTILHYEGKNRVLEDGDLLLVDIGAKYKGYCADITRTYPVNGSFSERQRQIYQLVLDAKDAAAAEMVPGQHSLNQMTTFVKNFFRASPLRAKDNYGRERTMDYFFTHGLCHYVGKDVHGADLPYNNSEPVKPGRIFTIEPGLYIESEGFGIRLEDTYIMSSRGAEIIMPNVAIEVEHIEAIMAARKLNGSINGYPKEYEPVKTRSTHMEF